MVKWIADPDIIPLFFYMIEFYILDRQSAERLAVLAEEAKTLLESYNQRLSKELEDRKNTAKQLRRFINDQKQALTTAERALQVYYHHS